MRHVWLLAALVAPAVAAAQTPLPPTAGQITFGEIAHTSTDAFINAAECDGPGTVHLAWLVSGTIPVGGVTYRVFAANQSSTGECPVANEVLPALPSNVNPVVDVTYATTTIAAAAGFDPATCSSTSAKQSIFLCVEAFDPSGNTSIAGVGQARGTVTLDRRPPIAPTGVSAGSGDDAVNVSWTLLSGTEDPPADYYVIDAEPAGTADRMLDPTGIHTSATLTATPYRLGGLVNFAVYNVRVFAFSPADNRSPDPTYVVTAQALPAAGFFDAYKAAEGREEGGCASGPAGLLAVAGAAALLVALRRRR